MSPEAKRLASLFSARMRSALTADELAEVNARNATAPYAEACASHDFLDANEVMLEALADAGLTFNPADDGQVNTINGAWNLAAECRFSL